MKIIAIGDNVIDCFLDRQMMYPGGQALNIAVFCKELGAESAYIGLFGDDEKASLTKNILLDHEIDIGHANVLCGENAYASVVINKGERIFLESNKGGVAKNHIWDFSSEEEKYLSSFDVIFTDQNSNMEKALAQISRLGKIVTFDFSRKYDDAYLELCAPYIDIAFISVGSNNEEFTMRKMSQIHSLGVKIVIATRGERGSIALFKDKFFFQNALPAVIVDTMGAGDSFEASFLVSIVKDSACLNNIDSSCIEGALLQAAKYAASVCSMEGSHGKGCSFVLNTHQTKLLKKYKEKEKLYAL